MENEYKSEYYDLMSIEVLIQALEKMRHRQCSIASFDFLLERIEILHEVEKEVIALKNKQIEQIDLIKTTASKTQKMKINTKQNEQLPLLIGTNEQMEHIHKLRHNVSFTCYTQAKKLEKKYRIKNARLFDGHYTIMKRDITPLFPYLQKHV